jgi:ATP synthase protein I
MMEDDEKKTGVKHMAEDDAKNESVVKLTEDDEKKAGETQKIKQINEKRELTRALSFLSQIGVTVVACLLIGVFAGKFLDEWLGTSPWLVLIFSMLGAGAAFKALFELSKRE